MSKFKCKICNKQYVDLSSLLNHIEHKHTEMIPQDMNVNQFYYYMKTGKTHGNCVMCKQPTTWNKNTNKYNRFCENPACKEKYREIFKKRMIGKYGKTHLLNDPEKQREMLAHRKISGEYKWSDGTKTTYTGTYDLDFLTLLDEFFDWDPNDISMPSPHNYSYMYDGVEKFYFPDVFIHSLDLEIEIKDGGNNPNTHPKIQAVDKVKEKLKDEVMTSQKSFNYIKIYNKNYVNFFNFLNEYKKQFEKYGDSKKIPRIFMIEDKERMTKPPKALKESYDEGFVQELFEPDKALVWLDKPVEKLFNKQITLYHGTAEDIKGKLDTDTIAVGSTKFSNPRWAKYYWDNYDYAVKWALMRMFENAKIMAYFDGQDNKIVLVNDSKNTNEVELRNIEKKYKNITGYVYEVKIDAKDIEIGASPVIKEYTVSKAMDYTKRHIIKLTYETLNKYCVMISTEEFIDRHNKNEFNIRTRDRKRGPILNNILSDYRDLSRRIIFDRISDENGVPNRNADLKQYKKLVNSFDHNVKKLNESYEPIYEVGSFLLDKITVGFGKLAAKYDFDALVMMDIEANYRYPQKVQEKIQNLLQSCRCDKDFDYIESVIRRTVDYYEKHPTIPGWIEYRQWIRYQYKKEKKAVKRKNESRDCGYERVIETYTVNNKNKNIDLSYEDIHQYLKNKDDECLTKLLNDYTNCYQRELQARPEAKHHINDDVKKTIDFIDNMVKQGVVDREFTEKHKSKLKRLVESNDTIITLIYNKAPNNKVFTLMDDTTKLYIGENYYIQRPIGISKVNCLISEGSLSNDVADSNIIQYKVTCDNKFNEDDIMKALITEGIKIFNLFDLNDKSNKFLHDICKNLNIDGTIQRI